MLIPAERADEEAAILRRVIAGGRVETYETVRLRKGGERIDVSLTSSPIREPGGTIVAALAIARDVSERKRLEGQLAYLADHDPLTGLFNRRRFEAELDRELERARRYRTSGALIVIDLDHFKYINDSVGHSGGDTLITQTAEIFRERLRTTDVIARLGGDEFAVILPEVQPGEARHVATNLLQALRAQTRVESPFGPRRVTASLGVAPFANAENVSGEELLDRFVLHAQPILSLTGDEPPRHELLIRMVGDDGDAIPPGTFLYVAERFDLVQDIDRWVLREAIRLLAEEQCAGNDIRLDVNISAKSLISPDLSTVVANQLDATGADGRGLCLEITETVAIVNIDRAKRFASEIGELGCEVALEGFGAGFASFYYLKHLTFDYVTIDGEFIAGLPENRTNQLVVRSIVDIARGMGKRTIAEFVRDTATLALLRSYGVDYAQGYHVAMPRAFASGDLSRAATVRPRE